MTRYAAHETLTAERASDLSKILDGARPAINRARLDWFMRRGFLVRGDAHENPAARWVLGSELAYKALGREPSDAKVVVYMQHGQYRMSR